MNNRLKIVADMDIPFLKGVLEPYFEVVYVKGFQINSDIIRGASALLIRTRTKCDRNLLDGTQISIIASATIGTDHIDTDYCKKASIEVKNAPGCNSYAVMQYVFTSLYTVAQQKQVNLKNKTFGVIGVGNVGSKVASLAEYLGMKVLRNDPPRENNENHDKGYFCSLDRVLEESDIVTLHIPLNKTTDNFAGESFFSKLKNGAIFINASRGEIVDEVALISNIERLKATIIDVWRNEPVINKTLLEKADIATPHIAGYSKQGKINGTVSILHSIGEHFNISELQKFYMEEDRVKLNFENKSEAEVSAMLNNIYDVSADNESLKARPQDFETLRSNYNYRREFYVQ